MYDDLFVEKVENEFLRGNFREALILANQFLTDAAVTGKTMSVSKHTGSRNCIDLKTDLKFEFDLLNHASVKLPLQSSRRLCSIRLHDISTEYDNENMFADRVSSIALQSWYELSKICKKSRREIFIQYSTNDQENRSVLRKGLDHLIPFIEANTVVISTIDDRNEPIVCRRTICLQLVLMFIQFCAVSLENTPLALEVAGDLLRSLQIQSKPIIHVCRTSDRQACCDLVLYLFVVLCPTCNLTDQWIENYFRYLLYDSDMYLSTPFDQQSAEKSTKNARISATVLAYQFCKSKKNTFPTWMEGTFEDCCSRLQDSISELETTLERQEISLPSTSDEVQEGHSNPIIPVHAIVSMVYLGLRNLVVDAVMKMKLSKFGTFVRNSFKNGNNDREKEFWVLMRSLISIVIFWKAWNHRTRLVKVARTIVTKLIANPVAEVLEAIGLHQNGSSTIHRKT